MKTFKDLNHNDMNYYDYYDCEVFADMYEEYEEILKEFF